MTSEEILAKISLEYYVIVLMWLNVLAWAESYQSPNHRLRKIIFLGLFLSFFCIFLNIVLKISSSFYPLIADLWIEWLLQIKGGLVWIHFCSVCIFCYCFAKLIRLRIELNKTAS